MNHMHQEKTLIVYRRIMWISGCISDIARRDARYQSKGLIVYNVIRSRNERPLNNH